MVISQETLTRIERLEELILWIIRNNQSKDINLPDDDVIVNISIAAAEKAEASVRKLGGRIHG